MKRLLNYVWINNKFYYDPAEFPSGSPIPTAFLNNAFWVAGTNPSIETNIWCDFAKMSAKRRQFLERNMPDCPNLVLRDLNEIEAYKTFKDFERREVGPNGKLNDDVEHEDRIWRKVDMARLLVLDHTLSSPDVDEAYYSDFDIIAPPLEDKKLRTVVRENGVVLGLYQPEGDSRKGAYVENSFMGFSRAGRELLQEDLLSQTRAHYAVGDWNGWVAFLDCVEKWLGSRKAINLEDCGCYVRPLWPHERQFVPEAKLICKGRALDAPSKLCLHTASRSSAKTSCQLAT